MSILIVTEGISPFVLALRRTALLLENKVKFVREIDYEEELKRLNPKNSLIILDILYNIPFRINHWLWNRLRMNEERIGQELAGLPVLVLGMDKRFLKTPEGKVFRDFPVHHQYLTKPLKLHKFLVGLSNLFPINRVSLCVIKGDAPVSMLDALEHDLISISSKFNYYGTDEDVSKRYYQIQADFNIYRNLETDKRKVTKANHEVNKLREEIINRRGKIWKKKFS